MGRGITYHLIGLGREKDNGRNCYPAHSKIEMRQVMRKAKRYGDNIEWWYAQTRTGCRILKLANIGEWTPTPTWVMNIRVIACPVCGHLPEEDQGCGICNCSGITTRANLKGYSEWQLQPETPRRFGKARVKTAPQKTDIVAMNQKPLEVQ